MEISALDIKTKIEEADLVLIGIGEEFEHPAFLKQDEEYERVCSHLTEMGMTDLMPYINVKFLKENEEKTVAALKKLKDVLNEKNYFIVSTCMNDFIKRVGFKQDRVVEPCGGYVKMQCKNCCENSIVDTEPEFLKQIDLCLKKEKNWDELQYPSCPVCGSRMQLNSLYTEEYDENGYLESWNTYMKWLQGTVNRKVCILELGVGLKYPSVIRWPFEKTGYLNKKACFIRVHERLFQLTPELKEQGYYIAHNAVNVLNLL